MREREGKQQLARAHTGICNRLGIYRLISSSSKGAAWLHGKLESYVAKVDGNNLISPSEALYCIAVSYTHLTLPTIYSV